MPQVHAADAARYAIALLPRRHYRRQPGSLITLLRRTAEHDAGAPRRRPDPRLTFAANDADFLSAAAISAPGALPLAMLMLVDATRFRRHEASVRHSPPPFTRC